jgi:Uma2 family endonuclease
MAGKLGVAEYLAGPEQTQPQELVWGVLREPPSPFYRHQAVVVNALSLLRQHVRQHNLGHVCVSPMDVVLDKAKALIVQPDVFFVSNARAGIIRDVVWGAPDLVVEVASRRSAARDRTTKLGWYRRYGVLECWLIDPPSPKGFGETSPSGGEVVVVDLEKRGRATFRRFSRDESVKSGVMPLFDQPARAFFE